jgi:hypothetical protein
MQSDSQDAGPDDALLPRIWLGLLLVATVGVGLATQAVWPMNPDVAWYIYMAERVVDGACPYVDLVEPNPPLIILLNMGVVLLARGIGCRPDTVLHVCIWGLAFLSLALGMRLSRGLPQGMRQAGLLAWACVLLAFPQGMFGQREHLMLILVLPYAQAAVAELRGDRPPWRLAVVVGLLGGLGFAIKPFFVPAALAIEVLLATRRGWRVWLRPQAVLLGVVLLGYAVLLVAWTPQYFATAREVAEYYPHFLIGGWALRRSSWRLLVVDGALALAWLLARRRLPEWTMVFGLLTVGLTVSVYLNGKGWMYHWLPAMSLSVVLLAGAIALGLLRFPPSRRRTQTAMWLGCLAPAVPALLLLNSLPVWSDTVLSTWLREYARPGATILVLAPDASFPFYNERTRRRAHDHRPAEISKLERDFRSGVADDFTRGRPVLLIVSDIPPRPELEGFDYLEYFENEPAFARELRHYEFVAKTEIFRIYRRLDAPPQS